MLLPLDNLAIRRGLNHWFDRNKIRPKVVAEFEDSALLKAFGAEGLGIFAAPTVISSQIIEQYGVQLVGVAEELHERFFAISVERRLRNHALAAVLDGARKNVF